MKEKFLLLRPLHLVSHRHLGYRLGTWDREYSKIVEKQISVLCKGIPILHTSQYRMKQQRSIAFFLLSLVFRFLRLYTSICYSLRDRIFYNLETYSKDEI